MTERALATIRRIDKISPIPEADRIEVVSIDGWKVVSQKGIHKEGDLVVYFEIDSLLPEFPEFEFLRKNCYVSKSQNGAGFRLKTIKLRGQVSQGMVMPISELEKYLYDPEYGDSLFVPEEGMNITDMLFVKKYEKVIPAQLAGKIRGNFPSFIPKTDQERIQNFIKSFLKNYRDHEWEVSLKLDGSSMTAYYYAPEDRFGICSRNLDLKYSEDNAFWQVATRLDLENKLRAICLLASKDGKPSSIAIQGELIGPGIQGNREGLTETEFFVFDVWSIDRQEYMPSDIRIEFCELLDLKHVPIYNWEKFGYDDANGFLELAEFGYGNGASLNNPIREGLVFKSVNDPNVSFKAISNKFLLEGGE